jgi:hypothetical protein
MNSWLDDCKLAKYDTDFMAERIPRHSVTVGSVRLENSVLKITTRLVSRGEVEAEVILDASRLPSFDAFAPLRITSPNGEHGAQPVFSGTIQELNVSGETAILQATNMSVFKEVGVAPWVQRELGAYDMIYMFARTSGIERGNINFHMETKDVTETVEVALFVTDCEISEPVVLGPEVRLIPNAVTLERFNTEAVPLALRTAVNNASAVAVTYVDGEDWLFEAEEKGYSKIIEAFDWITLQMRNGLSRDQGGRPKGYSRVMSRAALRHGGIVMATGLSTGRSWLRDRSTPVVTLNMESQAFGNLSPLPDRPGRQTRLAAAALARAAEEDSDNMARLAALWQALEYYAADVAVEGSFSAAKARSIRRNAVRGLEGEDKKRVLQVLQNLNSGSLMKRIAQSAENRNVSLTDSDRACLKDLRDIRNNSVHGGNFNAPMRDTVNQGVSIAARLILSAAN